MIEKRNTSVLDHLPSLRWMDVGLEGCTERVGARGGSSLRVLDDQLEESEITYVLHVQVIDTKQHVGIMPDVVKNLSSSTLPLSQTARKCNHLHLPF